MKVKFVENSREIESSENKSKSEEKANPKELHSIPCRIHFSGSAPVDAYFGVNREKVEEKAKSQEKSDKNESHQTGLEKAAFRGRPLNGADLNLPPGYQMSIMTTNADDEDENERKYTIQGQTNSFKYWNLDREPSQRDSIRKAVDWLKIAEALHK